MAHKHTIEHTQDEFGVYRYFVERNGAWIMGPYDSKQEAADAIRAAELCVDKITKELEI